MLALKILYNGKEGIKEERKLEGLSAEDKLIAFWLSFIFLL